MKQPVYYFLASKNQHTSHKQKFLNVNKTCATKNYSPHYYAQFVRRIFHRPSKFARTATVYALLASRGQNHSVLNVLENL